MALQRFLDRVAMTTATTGAGTVTLGSAYSAAYLTPAEAGINDGEQVTYLIQEGSDFEIGRGIYTASGTTLTRATVLKSKIGGAAGTTKMTLAGAAVVRVVASAKDLLGLGTHGADVTAASTIDLDAATGDVVDVTGNTGITAITLSEGQERTVRFTGSPAITHGSSLVLPGAASITMAAGDYAKFRGYASGVVRMVDFLRAAGRPLNSGVTDVLAAGFTAADNNDGTKTTGTYTPDPSTGNIRRYTNGGAHTLAPPSGICTMVIECTNSSAGALTTSGFDIVSGDTYSSSGTKKHLFYITRTNSFKHLHVVYVTGT